MSALFALTALALIFGAILGYAAIRFRVEGNPLADEIEAILPQTQCAQCGHPGCKPYAKAIANGEAFNKCAPGGEETIIEIANLLGVEPIALAESAHKEEDGKMVAFIVEDACIGCTKCIQACPVDAILGSNKKMHTVIAKECTGCELCVAPCPTDCIEMRPVATTPSNWDWKLQQIDVRIVEEDQP
ncbi:electron transport complex subunit RsxB [Alginatibacterium sediminis]|uniref:Ion-translocating oxidoreductase complex subunit B n=1 Tax=Alginatibacterium sediminis TaxID=2164068 RepID=A0A420EGY9_9ALTE|nr:electron transport complex subunit RsxB [Alginatibacterium sediminis]RKF19930.1 electron transport complex subunit RsxB [Alginatibacterium sediminis]